MSRRLRWVAAGCAAALIAVVASVVAVWGPTALEPASWVAGIAGVAVAVFSVFLAMWPADTTPSSASGASASPAEVGPPASSPEPPAPAPAPRIVIDQRAEARGKAQIRQAGRDLNEG